MYYTSRVRLLHSSGEFGRAEKRGRFYIVWCIQPDQDVHRRFGYDLSRRRRNPVLRERKYGELQKWAENSCESPAQRAKHGPKCWINGSSWWAYNTFWIDKFKWAFLPFGCWVINLLIGPLDENNNYGLPRLLFK